MNPYEINMKKSYYCGDAAGRKEKGHKDHSDSDLKFARNVGLNFYLPEQIFTD